MNKQTRYSPEVRERAVRLVFEHQGEHESQWAAIGSIASKIGCTAETLRRWVRQVERDQGKRPGVTSAEQARIEAPERDTPGIMARHCATPIQRYIGSGKRMASSSRTSRSSWSIQSRMAPPTISEKHTTHGLNR